MRADLSNPSALVQALEQARAALGTHQDAQGHWVGQLSSSALSTATAITALALMDATRHRAEIISGLEWLARHANEDGGWGDTILSLSNISTTTLCWAAFGVVPEAAAPHAPTLARAESWLSKAAGSLDPSELAQAIIARYGKDRTFSVPILTMCALAGRLGTGPEAWRHVIPLPFELAAFPHAWFAALRLPVVSYALPALIAIGQVRFQRGFNRNPLTRLIRSWTRRSTLKKLEKIQPVNGGFLEATPLTSFVTMSLAGMDRQDHPVARKGRDFLVASQREDGSWPIDTNLSTWVTTLAVNASVPLDATQASALTPWLLDQQYTSVHPYTQAAPGGWAWTNLPGGVPDADDTAGALLALASLNPNPSETVSQALRKGTRWLIDLQNRDGGIPTFCRGWGALPFDQSSPDITAHALRAWAAVDPCLDPSLRRKMDRARKRALHFLLHNQRADGSWLPLWFGNQHHPQEENPIYGTSRVLLALAGGANRMAGDKALNDGLERGIRWLSAAQNKDGSWVLGPQGSIEETALGLETMARLLPVESLRPHQEKLQGQVDHALAWLLPKVESGEFKNPAPIGFYFAKLWYYESLYPVIFTTAALQAALQTISTGQDGTASKNDLP